MCELTDRAKELESKLSDIDAHEVEVSLAAARLLLEDSREDDFDTCRIALTGALVVAEAVVEQFARRPQPIALDGDIHLGPYSYAPGRSVAELQRQLAEVERVARRQRDAVLQPIANLLIELEQHSPAESN